jgi:16S rRNA (guanine527-N7)-methyltransferase
MEGLLATPGLTAVTDPAEAWQLHVEDALSALPFVTHGPVVDVGSGGGSPGLPLASARPELHIVLLESSRRKCAFLAETAREFPNVEIVCARAEEHGRSSGRDAYSAALARALAPPGVAAEWCLPLVRPGGVCILYAGAGGGDLRPVARALGAAFPESIPVGGAAGRRLIVFRKVAPTPAGFPRRVGIARKRPLL